VDNHHNYPLFLRFENVTYYPYQHHDYYDDSDRCTLELLDIEALSVYTEGRNIPILEWRIIHQLNDDHQTSGRHSTSAAAIVERYRHDTEANASQDVLSAISIAEI
jgi:hypothetical protein